MIAQLENLKVAVESEESRKEELAIQTARGNEELAKVNEALSQAEARLAQLQAMSPTNAQNELLTLDVGGRLFKLYRSTFCLFPESVLATMMSSRWAPNAQDPNRPVFLDMNPDDFSEIVSFLRSRRINAATRSSFSKSAAELATYLGIPVNDIKGSADMVAAFPREGDKRGLGLAFDLFLRKHLSGRLVGMRFKISEAAKCIVYIKVGTFQGALATREAWQQVWEGDFLAGDCCIPLCINFSGCQLHSICLAFSKQCLLYSKSKGPATFAGFDAPYDSSGLLDIENGAAARTSAGDEFVVCLAGQSLVVGISAENSSSFMWPPRADSAMDEPRFFAGDLIFDVVK